MLLRTIGLMEFSRLFGEKPSKRKKVGLNLYAQKILKICLFVSQTSINQHVFKTAPLLKDQAMLK